jgi:hypothetical protein
LLLPIRLNASGLTQKQGRSGLGLEAQRAGVLDYLNGAGGGSLTNSWKSRVDGTAPGRSSSARWQPPAVHGGTLVVAKLDRLARKRGVPAVPPGRRRGLCLRGIFREQTG